MSARDRFRESKFSASEINTDLYKEARRVAAQAGEYTNPDGTTNADNITDYIANEYFSISAFKRRKDLEREPSNSRKIERERVYEYSGATNVQVIMLFHNTKHVYKLLKMENESVARKKEFGFNQKKAALAEMLKMQKEIDA